jgi:hypothetical protein
MKYSHKGNAKATTLASPCTPADMTVNVADPTGYPDGTDGPFWIALSKGQLIEEKILCSGRTGSLFAVWSDGIENGRGQDDTTAQDHPVNSPVEHVWTAKEAEESSIHVNEGDGAHGYPPKADLVTLAGDQTITGVKTIQSPILETPAATGGTHTGATKISLAGAQAEAEFRVRNTYIGVGDPDNSLGNDGDIYISKSL